MVNKGVKPSITIAGALENDLKEFYEYTMDISFLPDGNTIGGEDWCDIEIKKIRNKWESVETPIFSKNREAISSLIVYGN